MIITKNNIPGIPEGAVLEKISGGSDLAAGREKRAQSNKLSISESETVQVQHKQNFLNARKYSLSFLTEHTYSISSELTFSRHADQSLKSKSEKFLFYIPHNIPTHPLTRSKGSFITQLSNASNLARSFLSPRHVLYMVVKLILVYLYQVTVTCPVKSEQLNNCTAQQQYFVAYLKLKKLRAV